MYDQRDRSYVAWDIETTGFGWSEEITVSGFWFPRGHATLIINTGPHSIDQRRVQTQLAQTSNASVEVVAAEDEAALLQAMGRVIFERFDREYNCLVAYNAESWKGGFDLPFTRTRCIQHGIDWMFDSLLFADLWEPVKKRLNTTHTAYGASDTTNSLTGAYTILFNHTDTAPIEIDTDGSHPWYFESEYDPFDDSGSATAHYERGELLPVGAHNLADIHRAWELAELLREFVSSKDLSTKKL